MSINKTLELTDGHLGRLFLRYVLPGMASAASTFLFGVFDAMFVGQTVGELGIAATNVATPFFALQVSPALLMGMGGATLGAIAAGSGSKKEQNYYFTLSILVTLVIAVIEAILCLVYLREMSVFLGASDDTLRLTMDYLRPIVFATPIACMQPVISAYLRNDNAPSLVMVSIVISSFLNILLDYVMIVVWEMETFGAALATAISMVVGVLIQLTHFFRKKNTLRFVRALSPWKRLRKIIVCGLPSFVLEIAMGLSIFLFNRQLARYAGDIGIAAYAVCSLVQWLSLTFISGIGNGVQPIISTNFGAGKTERVKKTYHAMLLSAFGLGLCIFLLCQLLPEGMIRFFVEPSETMLSLSKRALRLYSISLPLLALSISMASYLQSIGFARRSTAIQLGRGIVFSAALLFTLPLLLGTDGIWLTPPMSELLAVALGFVLIHSAKNKIMAAELPAAPEGAITGDLPEE